MLKFLSAPLLMACVFVAGCASVPMASKDKDAMLKTFASPTADKSGIYIYRDTFGGQALKKDLSVDGVKLGETANKVYFYKEVAPGAHKIATESEFSDNEIDLKTEGGKNYFVEQYIKLGVFVGGANLKVVSEDEGRKGVLACGLAAASPGASTGSTNARIAPTSTQARSTPSDVQPKAAASNTFNARYMLQAERYSASLGCGAATFVTSGPGFETYSANCGEKEQAIRCDFGNCAAQ